MNTCALPRITRFTPQKEMSTPVITSYSIHYTKLYDFPGAFPPVELDGRVLIDGGVVNNVPVSVARDMGADIVIVSTFADQPVAARELTSVVSVLARTIDIMLQDSRTAQIASLSGDDVLIVIDLDDIGTSSFERAPETIEPGETAAREHFQRLADLGKSKARNNFV